MRIFSRQGNLNGGELDCENTWGTHKRVIRKGSKPGANLNGGELDKEPSLHSVGQQRDKDIKEDGKMKVLSSRTVLNGAERARAW